MQRKLLAALTGAIILTGCGSVKIGRINSDPSRYRNQTVHVSGTVVNSVGLLNTGGYQIEDDSGKIYVISRTGVPSRGSRVTLTGRVMPGAPAAMSAKPSPLQFAKSRTA